jgi:DNA repair protein RadC
MLHVLRTRLWQPTVIASQSRLLDYLGAEMGFSMVERFRVLHFDAKRRLIQDDLIAEGTVDHVHVTPRQIIGRALEVEACSIVLAHNHPSGDPTPSDGDLSFTERVSALARGLGIEVVDHLVLGAQGAFSIRQGRLVR